MNLFTNSLRVRWGLGTLFVFLAAFLPYGAQASQYASTTSGNWSAGIWVKQLTGSISVSNGSATVTGSGTAFSSELSVGDRIVLQSSPTTVIGTVSAITSNTSLTLAANASSNVNGAYGKQGLRTLTGSISVTSGSATVTGTGTAFSTELSAGDKILMTSAVSTVVGTVSSVSSNTSLTLTTNASASTSGTYAKSQSPNSSTDSLTVASGHAIVLDGNYSIATIQLNNSSNGSNSSSLTLANGSTGYSLTVAHSVNLNAGATGNNNTTLYVRNGTLNAGSIAIVGAPNGNRVCELRDSTGGSVNISGSVVFGVNINAATNSRWTHVGSGGSASIGGDFADFGTVTSVSGATMTFNGSGTQTISGAYSFYNLTVNKTSDTLKLGAATTVQNNLSVTSGIFHDNGHQISGPGTGSGTLTVGSGAELMLGASSATTMPTFQTSSLDANSTVTYDATVAQTVAAGSYGNLKFSQGGKKTAAGSLTVNGNLSIGSGSTFDAGSASHNLKKDFTNDGTFTKSTSTMVFSGTASQTISGTSTTSFNALDVNNTSFPVLMNSSINTSGTLTLRSGSLSIGSNTLTIGGTLTQVSGGLTGGTSSNLVVADSTGSATGLTLPTTTLNNLTVNRANGLTLGGPVTLNGNADLVVGLFVVGKNNITIKRPMHGTLTNFRAGDSSSITIGSTGSNDSTITIPSSVTSVSTLVIDNSAGVVTQGPLLVKDSLTLSSGQLSGSTASDTVQLAGGAVMNTTGGSLSGTVKYNYPIDIVYAGTASTSTGAELPSDATSLRNLTVNNTSGVTLMRNVTVNGDLTITAGTFDMSGYTASRGTSGGTLSIASGSTLKIGGTNGFPGNFTTHTISTGSVVEYDGTNQSVSPESYGGLTLGGSGTKTFSSGTTSVAGDFVISGSPAVNANGGTIQINGTGAQSIAGTTFNNLTINGAGTKTMTSGGTLSGNLTLSTGTLDLGTYSLDRSSAGGSLSLSNGTTLRIGGTGGFPSGYTTNTIAAASTVEYYGSTQTIGALTYGNLTTSGGTKTIASNTSVGGTLSIDSYISTGTDTLTLGTGTSNLGSLAYSSGGCIGCMKRWFASATVNNILYPVTEVGRYVPNNLSFTNAPTTGGTVVTCFIPSNPGTSGLPLNDGSTTVANVAREGYWYIHNGDGLSGGTYSVELTGTEFSGITDYQSLRILKRPNSHAAWQALGSHMAGMGSNSTPTARRGGLTSFSDFGLGGGSDNVLPVTLTGFDGRFDQGAIGLTWRTASEYDNAGFVISRSINADSGFTAIASYLADVELKGQGRAPTGADYRYEDADGIEPGAVYYYKLEQVDIDGTRHAFAKIVQVTVPQAGLGLKLLQNVPNPAHGSTTIGFQLPSASSVEITLFDALGRQVRRVETVGAPGQNSVALDLQNLPAGKYIYRLRAGSSTRARTMIVGE